MKQSNFTIKNILRKFIQENCILRGNFTLSSGDKSDIYFDIRKATLNNGFLKWLCHYTQIHVFQKYTSINIVGGPSVGADFVTSAILCSSEGVDLHGSIYRKPKQHGTRSNIENLITEGCRNILVVDDVLTTGDSIKLACNEFLRVGYNIKVIYVILDRSNGMAASMLEEKYKCPVISIFTESDFER